ncbi:MAG: hypothetical protein QNJ13_14130 [Paracoccaceae bacterium]|nr:hypothetical protein [Paracoccaceae bacterium]
MGGYSAAGLFWGALAAAAPALQARVGLDAGGFGLALGVMTLAAFPVMQVFGRVVQRIRPLAIPLCVAASALGCGVLAGTTSLAGFVAALAILGGASGALDISLNLRTARLETDTGARLFNRTHALFPIAMLAGSVLTGWARAGGVSVTAIFLAVGAGFLAVAVVEFVAGRHQGADAAGSGQAAPMLGVTVVILAAMAALAAFQEAAPQAWAAIFVETVRGEGPGAAGLAPAAYTLGLALGRLGAHEIEHRLRPVATIRLAALLGAPAFAALVLGLPTPMVLASFLLAGIGTGPVEPAVFKAVSTRGDPASAGRRLATVTQIAYLGYLLSPPALGAVAQYLGFTALWLVSAAAALAVAGLSLTIPRQR